MSWFKRVQNKTQRTHTSQSYREKFGKDKTNNYSGYIRHSVMGRKFPFMILFLPFEFLNLFLYHVHVLIFLNWKRSKAKTNIDTEKFVQDGQYVKFESTDFSKLDHHRKVKECSHFGKQITFQLRDEFFKELGNLDFKTWDLGILTQKCSFHLKYAWSSGWVHSIFIISPFLTVWSDTV